MGQIVKHFKKYSVAAFIGLVIEDVAVDDAYLLVLDELGEGSFEFSLNMGAQIGRYLYNVVLYVSEGFLREVLKVK